MFHLVPFREVFQNQVTFLTVIVLQDMMTQIQTDLDAKLKFNSFHASGLPPSNKVKLIIQCTPVCFCGIIFGALVSVIAPAAVQSHCCP